MRNIDMMINDIYDDETIEIDSQVNPEMMSRVEDNVIGTIFGESSVSAKTKNETKTVTRKKTSFKAFKVLLLVAVLCIGAALTATAGVKNEWDIDIVNMLGVSDADTVQLEDGVVTIGAGYVANGTNLKTGEDQNIMLVATSSIGAKNAVALRLDTDYEMPEDFNPETDYFLPENLTANICKKKDQIGLNGGGYGMSWKSIDNDGKLSFIVYISGCEDVNRSYVELTMKGLKLYHDLGLTEADEVPEKDAEELFDGEWNLSWKYSYKSRTVTRKGLNKVEVDGIALYINKIEVTPVGIYLKAFTSPFDRNKITDSDWGFDKITLKDGTEIVPNAPYSIGGCLNGMKYNKGIESEMFGQFLDPYNVESVTIAGKTIKVN